MSGDPLGEKDLILDPIYKSTPIHALHPISREEIAQFMDLEGTMVLSNELYYINNYIGLCELIGFGSMDISNIANKSSPTQELLNQWTTTRQGQEATIGSLWSHLLQLKRFDVLKDCKRNILNDCHNYEAKRVRIKDQMGQDPRGKKKGTNQDMEVDETKNVTVQDINSGEMTLYDVFICYAMENEEDRQFVRKLIQKLEVEPESSRKLQLFVPGRDDLPGSAAHTINAYLIEKRCRRMIIVMSKAFLDSAACDFQIKFAHCLAPGARNKRLIPVIKDIGVPLPRILRFLAVCDFTKSHIMEWAWEKLYTAIVSPMPPTDGGDDESSNIDELRNIMFPVSRCVRSNDPESASTSGHRGIVVERNFASSSNSSEPIQVAHQSTEQSGKPVRQLLRGQEGDQTYVSLQTPEAKQSKKNSKSSFRFPFFKKKQQQKPTQSTTSKTLNNGSPSGTMYMNANVPFGATRDQLSRIVHTQTRPEESSCRQKSDERVEIDLKHQSASHRIEQVDSVRPKREPMENPDSLLNREEPVQHLDVERQSDSVKPRLCGKE